jgi:hypothetical protein
MSDFRITKLAVCFDTQEQTSSAILNYEMGLLFGSQILDR